MTSIDFAIMHVESGGNDEALGDNGKAFGPLQIWQPVCDDVNAKYGTHFKAQELRGRRSLSLAVFWLYMSIYAVSSRLGRPVTDEDRARIWNGGPSAWNTSSPLHAATDGYWRLVQKAMKA